MRAFVAVAAACTVGLAAAGHPVDVAIVDEVNSMNVGWKAEVSQRFANWTLDELKRSMGVHFVGHDTHIEYASYTDAELAAVPASFDARTQWPGCIGQVLDQAKCGSCWAFGAAEAISDRMCIEGLSSPGKRVRLAELDLVACDNGWFNNGCQGGQPSAAWQWAQSNGLVTEECLPYLQSEGGPMPTCAPADEPCMPPTFVQTPACKPTCKNGATYSQDKHKTNSTYNVPNDAQSMAAELVKNGPFEVSMTVYADFVHYKSGVYTHQSGQALGGHAIKVVGFGTENGQDYWLVQNSWTTTWGDKGYFKIAKGVDECGIEDAGVAGTL